MAGTVCISGHDARMGARKTVVKCSSCCQARQRRKYSVMCGEAKGLEEILTLRRPWLEFFNKSINQTRCAVHDIGYYNNLRCHKIHETLFNFDYCSCTHTLRALSTNGKYV